MVQEAAEDEVHGGEEDEQQQEELHLNDPLDARDVDERQQEQGARGEGLLRPRPRQIQQLHHGLAEAGHAQRDAHGLRRRTRREGQAGGGSERRSRRDGVD